MILPSIYRIVAAKSVFEISIADHQHRRDLTVHTQLGKLHQLPERNSFRGDIEIAIKIHDDKSGNAV